MLGTHKPLQMARPALKPLPHLRQILKSVIDACHPAEASAFMIEDPLHDVWRNAQPPHMRRGRAAQIMQRPSLDVG